MYRNWKKTAALGLAVLIGCMMPMSTMLAAEDDAKTGVSSVSDNDVLHGDENTPDSEKISDGDNIPDSTDVGDGLDDEKKLNKDEETGGDEGNTDDESVDLETAPAVRKAQARNAEAPKIAIKWNGRDLTCEPGGKVAYEYMNYNVKAFAFEVSASHAADISYYLNKVTDVEEDAMEIEELEAASATWPQLSSGETIQFNNDGTYVLYVKAVGENGQSSYARSGGIVGDTQAPEVTGVEEGKPYTEGTVFQIADANLESVTINEKPVELSADGKYQVTANGTSCVIKVKDKAGNETVRSITVLENGTLETDNVISRNGIYALKAGEKYHLGQGKWKISGDRSVYQGGNDFYVKADGNYGFWKYLY